MDKFFNPLNRKRLVNKNGYAFVLCLHFHCFVGICRHQNHITFHELNRMHLDIIDAVSNFLLSSGI
jgi:hypothetical protein